MYVPVYIKMCTVTGVGRVKKPTPPPPPTHREAISRYILSPAAWGVEGEVDNRTMSAIII